MLLSMTGFGEAHCQHDGVAVGVEVRAINNRFFKLSVRATEGYGALEPQIEAVVRQSIRRGTVQVNLRVDRVRSPEEFQHQRRRAGPLPRPVAVALSPMGPARPDGAGGAVGPAGGGRRAFALATDPAEDWPLIGATLEAALENLARMRRDEGRAMAADLTANCRVIAARVDQIGPPGPAGRRRLPPAAPGAAEAGTGGIPGHARPRRAGQGGQPVRRARRHLRGDRPPPEPPRPVRRHHGLAGEHRAETRIPHPGNVPRGQHDRLEGQRRGNRQGRDRDQDGHRTDPRDDPKRGVEARS